LTANAITQTLQAVCRRRLAPKKSGELGVVAIAGAGMRWRAAREQADDFSKELDKCWI
jgi:hypothetical protein